jgi:hypothetical protein
MPGEFSLDHSDVGIGCLLDLRIGDKEQLVGRCPPLQLRFPRLVDQILNLFWHVVGVGRPSTNRDQPLVDDHTWWEFPSLIP